MSKYIPDLYDKLSKVQFFYNEFKLRDANPDGFDSKMKNWYSSINKYCDEEDRFLIDINELRTELEYLNCRPHLNCLRLVITNMIKERKLLPIDDFKQEFINQNANGSWINWGVSSVKKTFSWFSSGVTVNNNYVETIDDRLKNDNIKLVNINVFDRLARKVLNYLKENNMYAQILKSDETEDKLCDDLNLDKKHYELIIQFLESKGNCKRTDGNLIKFDESNTEITDKELSLKRLEDAKLMIESDMDKLEDEIEKLKEEAREAIKQNNKSKGLSILKKKQRLTQQFERKNNQLDNIEILEDQLLNSDANKKILEVLAKSSQVLKLKNQPEDIDDLLFTIEEAVESHKTLQHDISRPIGGQQFDEDELEEELNQLIEEDEIEKIASSSTDKIKQKPTKVDANSKVPVACTSQPADNLSESDELFERFRKLKEPPVVKKKDKVRYALTDDL